MICPPLPLPTGAILLMHVGPRKTVFFVGKVVQIGGCKFGQPLTGIISQVSKLRSGLLIRQLCIPVFEITRICDENKSNICIPFTKAILGCVKNLKCCISVLFQTGTQKLTSSFHNLCYWNPILKKDASMCLWINFLIFYIIICLLKEGQNFNPSSCSVFPKVFRIGTQNCTSKFHNLSCCKPILTWDTSMNLWFNFLIFYIQTFLF